MGNQKAPRMQRRNVLVRRLDDVCDTVSVGGIIIPDTRRSRSTPRSPNTVPAENRVVPRDGTL